MEKKKDKLDFRSTIVIDAYAIVRRAVEEGAAYGVNRAFKHTDNPSRDHIADEVEQAVMLELCSVLHFIHPEEQDKLND